MLLLHACIGERIDERCESAALSGWPRASAALQLERATVEQNFSYIVTLRAHPTLEKL